MNNIEQKCFDVVWLVAIGLAPSHGGGALILLICLAALGCVQSLRGYSHRVPAPVQMVAGVFVVYFLYFYLHGALLGSDIAAPYSAMKGNIPLLLVAGYGMLGASGYHRFDLRQLGIWASVAVIMTVLVVIFLYWARHFYSSFVTPIEHTVWAYGGSRLEMFSRNPLMFASLLTTVSFLSLLEYRNKTQWQRVFAVVAVPLGLTVVLAGAQARGILVLCIPLVLLSVWYLQLPIKRLLIFAFLVLVLFVAFIYIFDPVAVILEPFVNRLTATWVMFVSDGYSPEQSLLQRIRMFQLGWSAILDSPWLGYGYQNRFDAIVPLMAASDDFRHGHLHNVFLNHWVAGGVVGLFLSVAVLGLPVYLYKKYSGGDRSLGFLAILITIMMIGTGLYTAIFGHFVHTTFYGMMILTLALALKSQAVRRNN